VDPTLLAQQGLPYYAGTWIVYLLSSNIGMAATFTHLLLWNRDDLRAAWSWMNKESIKQMWAEFDWRFWRADGTRERSPNEDSDPHYLEMLKVCSVLFPDAHNCLSICTVHGRPEQLVWCNPCIGIHHGFSYYLQNRFNSPLVSAGGMDTVSFGLIGSFLSIVGGASSSPVYWQSSPFSFSGHFMP
jgi:hypothetical protein